MAGTIIALVVAIPVVLFPAALVWHINIGGALAAVKARTAKTAAVAVK